MKKSFSKLELFIFVISLFIIATAFVINQTNHILLISGAILLLLGIVHFYTPWIAGLSPDNPKVKTMRRMNILNMIFVVVLCIMTNFIDIDLGKNSSYEFWIIIFIMILFGNIAPKLPFNRYTGLRLPWTIRDENTWRIAHKALGYLTFPFTILMIISYFFIDNHELIALIGMITWIMISGIYSFMYFIKKQSRK